MKFKLDEYVEKLPLLPNVLRGRHWGVKKKESDEWNRIFGFIAFAKGKPEKPIQKAKLIITRYSAVEPDPDNNAASCKPVIDALRHNGFLKDDKSKNIGVPEFKWEKVAASKGKIRVQLVEI